MNTYVISAGRRYLHIQPDAIIWCLEATGKSTISRFIRNSILPASIPKFGFYKSKNTKQITESHDLFPRANATDEIASHSHSQANKADDRDVSDIRSFKSRIKLLKMEYNRAEIEELCQDWIKRLQRSSYYRISMGYMKKDLVDLLLTHKCYTLYKSYIEKPGNELDVMAEKEHLFEAVRLGKDNPELATYYQRIIKDENINSMKFLKNMVHFYIYTEKSPKEAMKFYLEFCFRLYGHFDFTSGDEYKNAIAVLQTIIARVKRLSDIDASVSTYDSYPRDIFISTMLFATSRAEGPRFIDVFWKWKADSTKTANDLTWVMEAYTKIHDYDSCVKVYKENESLHCADQYSSLLEAYGHSPTWNDMQTRFESLFEYKDLPDINHYGIVMNTLARSGNIHAVMTLWEQIFTRKFKPTLETFIAVLDARYHYGDYDGVFEWYKKISSFDLEPDSRTIISLLKALRKLGDAHTSLELLQGLIDKKFPMSSEYFVVVLGLSNDLRNYSYALKVWRLACGGRLPPSLSQYIAMLKCCLSVANEKHFAEIFADAEKLYPNRMQLYAILIDFQAMKNQVANDEDKSKQIEISKVEVEKIKDEMKKHARIPERHYYASMIRFLFSIEDYTMIDKLLIEMHDSYVNTDRNHYHLLMKGYSASSQTDKVIQVYDSMLKNGIQDDELANGILLRSLLLRDRIRKDFSTSKRFFKTILKGAEGLKSSIAVFGLKTASAFIRTLARLDDNKEASELLNRYNRMSSLSVPRIPMVKASITVLGEKGDFNNVMDLFKLYYSLVMDREPFDQPPGRTRLRSKAFYGIWSYVMEAAHFGGRQAEVLEYVKGILKRNAFLSTLELHHTVWCLMDDPTYFLDAMNVIELKLIPGNIRESEAFSNFYISKSPHHRKRLMSPEKVYQDIEDYISYCLKADHSQQNVLNATTREQCRAQLEERFPLTMRFISPTESKPDTQTSI